jgi:anti-anti-sigma factor
MKLQFERPPATGDTCRGVIVVHFTGDGVRLDEATLRHVHDPLLALADEPGEPDLLLDFGNVVFLTSTALMTLVSLRKKLLTRGRRLTVAHLCPQVHEVFTVTRLDHFLDLRLAEQPAQPTARERQDRWIETPWKGV